MEVSNFAFSFSLQKCKFIVSYDFPHQNELVRMKIYNGNQYILAAKIISNLKHNLIGICQIYNGNQYILAAKIISNLKHDLIGICLCAATKKQKF